jgi:alcohol dehydrogenase (cytochrome c)
VRDYIAGLDAATGKLLWRKYAVPSAGEPGSETWKDRGQVAWQTGGGAMWVTGSYDPASDQVISGTGNPVPMFDAYYRPGDNLYTNSVVSWNPDVGRMNWYFQFTPGDPWDYDEIGSHILIDGQSQRRNAQAHHPLRPQRFSVHDGADERADRVGQALSRQHQLDEGY